MVHDDSRKTVETPKQFLTRRKMLALSSAAVGTSLAGCSGGNDPQSTTDTTDGTGDATDSTDSTNSTDSAKLLDDTADTFCVSIPTRMTWNPWATNYPWTPSWMVLEPVLRFFADGSIELEQIDDWSYDENEQSTTIKFSEDWYWWNGDQVTAEDKYQFERTAHNLDPEGSNLKELELIDDFTLKRVYKEPQNPQLLEYQLGGYLGAMNRGHRDKFREWADTFGEAATQDERNNLRTQMEEEMPISTQTLVDEGLGMGPFELVDFDSQMMVFEKFDKHPYADEINVPKFQYRLSKDQALAQRIKGDELDFGFGLLQEWVGEGVAPDNLENIVQYTDTYTRKLDIGGIGQSAEHLRKLEVRRALAHVVNSKNIATNYDAVSTPIKTQTGLPAPVSSEWLDEENVSNYIDYPVGSDLERAAELMRSAGYERNGNDKWVGEDGEEITLDFPITTTLSNPGRTVSSQLEQFGFNVDFRVLEGTTMSANYKDKNDWDITIDSHGDLAGHPSAYFRTGHQFGNELGEPGAVKRWLDDGETRSQFNGREIVVEIPTEIGATDLSGDTEEINIFELYQQWQTAQTDEENLELLHKFSWYWNFHLPQIDLVDMQSGHWGDFGDFEFAKTDSKHYTAYRGNYRALKRGLMSAKSK